MEAFEKAGYVKSERKGAKYLFSIVEKGQHYLLSNPTAPKKEAGIKPASNPGLNEGVLKAVGHVVPAAIRPVNTDIQCQACKTWNIFSAEYCKECGNPIKAEAVE